MKVIGNKVYSKKTGVQGIITDIKDSKIYVSFSGNSPIKVKLADVNMSTDLREAIADQIKTNKNANKSVKGKRSCDINNEILFKKYKGILDSKEKLRFYTNFQTLNTCMGTNYRGYQRVLYNVIGTEYACWFPKLVNNIKDEPAAFGCVNVISDDWNTVIFDDHKERASDEDWRPKKYTLVFAREPKQGPILFRGVFIYDERQSRYKHAVYRRVCTKIKLIGNPVHDIEMLDKVEK